MKLTVLAENTTCRNDLTAEHGLCLYLEAAGKRILLDMGQSDAFAQNAQRLGIDLAAIDIAVLSHGHYDHGGGLKTFLRRNQTACVYVHKDAFGAYYNGTQKYIGLDPALKNHPRLIAVQGSVAITGEISLHDANDCNWKFQSWGLNQKIHTGFTPDTFTHEQYLQIIEGGKRILLSGCSHKGVDNIVTRFRPDVLIGGFHLNKQEDIGVLTDTAKYLMEYAGICYTGHCTGEMQYNTMKKVMGQQLQALSTGMTIEV